jgi:hypothetical protein
LWEIFEGVWEIFENRGKRWENCGTKIFPAAVRTLARTAKLTGDCDREVQVTADRARLPCGSLSRLSDSEFRILLSYHPIYPACLPGLRVSDCRATGNSLNLSHSS